MEASEGAGKEVVAGGAGTCPGQEAEDDCQEKGVPYGGLGDRESLLGKQKTWGEQFLQFKKKSFQTLRKFSG